MKSSDIKGEWEDVENFLQEFYDKFTKEQSIQTWGREGERKVSSCDRPLKVKINIGK